MNIVILTNTFTPHVGGVARSVQAFTDAYRERGHRVLVVAPEFPGTDTRETDVVRVPAFQNFNASDFSVAMPIPKGLGDVLDDFQPEVVHSQHPFLLGMTAVRVARQRGIPLVFTHHTLYEQYTHYVPGDSPVLQRFIIELATHYANLSDQVFAPSESIRDLLVDRGVTTDIQVVPTGVRVERFSQGDGPAYRRDAGLPAEAFVVGHLGRLAPEKNLEFLARAVAEFMGRHEGSHFLVVGEGPSEEAIRDTFQDAGLADRLHIVGVLERDELAAALNAMDVFAFASKSETQGMVLTEAMAAGLPVVALDASGAREVVRDTRNGRLLDEETPAAFAEALDWVYGRPEEERRGLVQGARDTAEAFSLERSADTALECFRRLGARNDAEVDSEERLWEQVMGRIRAEWEIVRSVTRAGDGALSERSVPDESEGA